MSTLHNNAKPGDFAKVVLMPGDPNRAKWIAETFLTDIVLVNNVRGVNGYTGYTKSGKRISVMASGMGMPSIGIYSYELFKTFEVDVIIRIGTAGSYNEAVHVGDLVLAQGACTNGNNIGNQYLGGGNYSAIADFELLKRAYEKAEELNFTTHVGNVLSSDMFYTPLEDEWKKWSYLQILAVEMETYALYTTASSMRKKALCILTITDSFITHKSLTTEERERGLNKMVELAIETAEKYL